MMYEIKTRNLKLSTIPFFIILMLLVSQDARAQTFETLIPASSTPQFSRDTGERLEYSIWSEQGIHSYGGIGNHISTDSIVIIAHKYCSAIGREQTLKTIKDFILLNSKGELLKRFVFDNRSEQPNWGGNLQGAGVLEADRIHTDGKHYYNDFEIWDYESSPFVVGEYGVSHRYSFSELWEPGIIKPNPDFDKKLLGISSLRIARTPSNGIILIVNSQEKLWCFYIDSSNQLVSRKKIKTKFGKEIIKLSEVVALDDNTFAISVDWESKKENKNSLIIANTSGKVISHTKRKSGSSEKYPSHKTESLFRMHDGSLVEFYSKLYFEPAKKMPKANPEYPDFFKGWVQVKSINLNVICYEPDGSVSWQKENIEALHPRHKSNFVDACQLSNGNIVLLHSYNKSSSTLPKFILLNPDGETIKKSQIGTLRSYKHRLSPTLDGGALAVGIYLDDPDSSTIHVMKFDSLGNIDNVIVNTKILLTKANNILNSKLTNVADSLKTALKLYHQTLEQDPHNRDALWGAANILEYTGLYEEAAGLYRALSELDGLSKSYKKEVLAHAITCEYLVGKERKTVLKPIQKQVQELAKVIDTAKFTETAVAERSKWSLLKELAATVVTVAGTALNGADDATIRRALSLLDGWIDAPAGQEIEARNRYLNGMLAEIATLIIRNKLGIPINNAMSRNGQDSLGTPPQELAQTNTQGRENFKSLEAPPKEETSEKVQVSEDFSVSFSGESSTEGISGMYKCISVEFPGKAEALRTWRESNIEIGRNLEDYWFDSCVEPGTYNNKGKTPAQLGEGGQYVWSSGQEYSSKMIIYPVEILQQGNTIEVRMKSFREEWQGPSSTYPDHPEYRYDRPEDYWMMQSTSQGSGQISGNTFVIRGETISTFEYTSTGKTSGSLPFELLGLVSSDGSIEITSTSDQGVSYHTTWKKIK